jgi:hypothetical protein
MLRALLLVVVTLFALPAATAQTTERYALIVGASGYRAPIRSLLGPRNDVTLLTNTLVEQGVPRDNIRVLADGLSAADYPIKVTPNGDPTRARILAELDRLAEIAGPNSEVLIFFAGHGSQFPSASEPDGLDEFFLPIDVRRSTTPGQPPANILLDDDLQPKIAAILNRGAFVWLIVDACHSGSLSRAGDTSRSSRFVTPEELGATRSMIEAAQAAAREREGAEVRALSALDVAPGARFVGFYAAQPTQVTYESAAPKSLPGPQRRMHGEFTWSLVNALRANAYENYSSIASRIVAQYWEGHSDVAPYFEGDLQMRPMMGAGNQRVSPLIARNGQLYVRAGAVDGLSDGAVLALLDLSSNGGPIGRAIIVEMGMTESRLEISERTDPGGLIERARLEGGPQAARLGARVLQPGADFIVRLAPVQTLNPSNQADATFAGRSNGILSAIAALPAEQQPLALQLTPANEAADLYPIVADNRLWLLRHGERLDLNSATPPFSIPAESASTETVGRALRIMGRARNLLRVTREAGESPISRNLGIEAFATPGQPGPGGACAQHDETERTSLPTNARPLAANLEAARVQNCDIVFVRITNTGVAALDVTPLYIGPWSDICFLATYTNALYEGMRLNPGQSRIISYTEEVPVRGGARGLTNLVFIAAPSRLQGPPQDFRYLAACGEMDRADLARRDVGAAGFAGLLYSAGFGTGSTRSAPPNTDFSGGAISLALYTERHE